MDLSGTDLAGLAALIGVPAALVTALLPLRERAVLMRLERIDGLLRGTDLDEEHAELLRTVRNHLVRRVAVSEMLPGYPLWTWVAICVAGVCAVAWGIYGGTALAYEQWRQGIPWAAASVVAALAVLGALSFRPRLEKRQAALLAGALDRQRQARSYVTKRRRPFVRWGWHVGGRRSS